MTQETLDGAPNMFPFLRYHDATAAIEWLVRAFGFQEQMVVPGEDGTVAHAQLSFGPGVIILGTARDDELRMKSPRDLGAVNQGIYVYLDDVDTHCARAKGAGAEIVRICLALPEATENPFGGHSPDLARARQDLRYDHRHRRGRR